jgi:anti-anti-sigma factor
VAAALWFTITGALNAPARYARHNSGIRSAPRSTAGGEMVQILAEQDTPAPDGALTFTGEFDFTAVLEFRREFLTMIQLAHTDIVVSLANVSFLDCAALGLLVEAWRCASDHGNGLSVTAPRQAVAGRVLDVLGPTLPFPVVGRP